MRPRLIARSAADDLPEGPDHVHGARAASGRAAPRHATGDREVDLERPGSVPVAPVGARDARGQPLTGDLDDGAGREVEHDRVGRR